MKALREAKLLSQEQLARSLNLSYRTIAEWENGRQIPKFNNAIALARSLGVSLETLAESMNLDAKGLSDGN